MRHKHFIAHASFLSVVVASAVFFGHIDQAQALLQPPPACGGLLQPPCPQNNSGSLSISPAGIPRINSGETVNVSWTVSGSCSATYASVNGTTLSASGNPALSGWSGTKTGTGTVTLTGPSVSQSTLYHVRLSCVQTVLGSPITNTVTVSFMVDPPDPVASNLSTCTVSFADGCSGWTPIVQVRRSGTAYQTRLRGNMLFTPNPPAAYNTWSAWGASSTNRMVGCDDVWIVGTGSSNGTTATVSFTSSRASRTLTCTPVGTAVPAAPTLTFTANPAVIATGGSSTLTWTSANATGCTASNGWTGAKALSGSETVTPAGPATYTLTCTGAGGTIARSATVSTNPPVISSFTAASTSIPYNTTTTLSWSSTNSTACTASGGWSGAQATSGTYVTPPLTAATTYTLTCTGTGGTSAPSSVTVTPAAPTLTTTLSGSPVSGNAPLNVTLTATTGGTAIGTLNYTFYCHNPDTSTTVIAGYNGKFDGVSNTTQSYTCSYASAGTYTPKVIVERGSLAATATGLGGTGGTITVSAAPPPNPPPVATLSTPTTNQTIAPSVPVSFSGTATDSNGTVAGYEWRDGNCATGTILSTAQSFTTSALTTTGTHPIYFRARDNQGAWSTNCPSRTITVQSASPCAPQAPRDPPNYTCNANNTANLTWDWAPGVAGAQSYQLTVDDTSNFSSPLLTNQPVTAPTTSYVMNNQLANRTYYGRVRSMVNTGACAGTSAWSTTATLNPICPPPANNVVLVPDNTTVATGTPVTYTATVTGNQTGTINYTFYCDRLDTNTNITTPWDAKLDGVSNTVQSFSCNYTSAQLGLRQPKVIIERGSAPSAQDQAPTTVAAAAPTLNLSASPTSITTGGSSTLTWTSFNTTTCTASGGWSGGKALSGTQGVTPAATTTYTLACTGPGGNISRSASVTVSAALPTADLKANGGDGPIALFKGRTFTLTWSSSNTASCSVSSTDSSWTGGKPLNNATGETLTYDASGPVTYTLTCTGPGGSRSDSILVNPRPIPVWTEVAP